MDSLEIGTHIFSLLLLCSCRLKLVHTHSPFIIMRYFRLHFLNEIIQLQLLVLGRRNNLVHSKSQLENLISICWLLSCIIYFHCVKEMCKRFVLFISHHSRSNCDAESTMHINMIEFKLFIIPLTDARARLAIRKKCSTHARIRN